MILSWPWYAVHNLIPILILILIWGSDPDLDPDLKSWLWSLFLSWSEVLILIQNLILILVTDFDLRSKSRFWSLSWFEDLILVLIWCPDPYPYSDLRSWSWSWYLHQHDPDLRSWSWSEVLILILIRGPDPDTYPSHYTYPDPDPDFHPHLDHDHDIDHPLSTATRQYGGWLEPDRHLQQVRFRMWWWCSKLLTARLPEAKVITLALTKEPQAAVHPLEEWGGRPNQKSGCRWTA